MPKKKISCVEKIRIKLSKFNRDLILENTFIEQEYVDLLESAILKSGFITINFTLDDLDLVLGHIATSANHAEDKNLEAELDKVYDYLTEIESNYIVVDE